MTIGEIRATIKSVVEAHDTHNNWYSIWSEAKDRPSVPVYPLVAWGRWKASLVENELEGTKRKVSVQLLITDDVATNRTQDERDQACEAAEEAASWIFLHLKNEERWDVEDMSVKPLFDDGTTLETGVVLTFSVLTDPICADTEPLEPEVCPTLCELLGADDTPLDTAACVTDENAPLMGSILIQRETYTPDLIVEHIGNADKTEEVQALICETPTCDPLNIVVNGTPYTDVIDPCGGFIDIPIYDSEGSVVPTTIFQGVDGPEVRVNDLPASSCPLTINVTVNGSAQDPIADLDPCEDHTINITIS